MKEEIAKLYFGLNELPFLQCCQHYLSIRYSEICNFCHKSAIIRVHFLISYHFISFSYTRFFFCHRAFDSARFRTQKCSLRRLVYHVLYLYDLHFACTPFTRMRCGRSDAGHYATSSGCQSQSE